MSRSEFIGFDPADLAPEVVARRRRGLLLLVLLLAAPAVLTMTDLHWRTGWDAWKGAHLILFGLLFGLVALGAAQSLLGFFLRRRGDPWEIEHSLSPADADRMGTVQMEPARTAVVMPICNEDVPRVIAGLRITYESLMRTGKSAGCDFFLLSDSTNVNCWIEEEAAWLALTRQLDAPGRIFYRKRRSGINKKAGNLADFCRRWGRHYRYMVVLDADSIMTGEAIVRLIQLMERNPRTGIIQSIPVLVKGETALARVQQFASRLYGPLGAAGLNYWQLGEGNYWGHNAIIRLGPFMRHCSLPELPGTGPFGGRIMSHDYVEAALMRRAGWQVWLATTLGGSYEESPANLVDYAQRDRRWLQGNLQHGKLIIARGFHAVNRVHFALGILSFLASPLWLAFLLVSVAIAHHASAAQPMWSAVSIPAGGWLWSYHSQAFCLFVYTLMLLFMPKITALCDLRTRPERVAAFGGWKKIGAGVLLETLLFTLLAPVLMMFHSKFILLTLCRQKIAWGAQRRGREGHSRWVDTVAAHWGQTLLGIGGAILVWRIDPALLVWMAPILAGLICAIPLSYLTGSLSLGLALQRRGILQTPEEVRPPAELTQLDEPRGLRAENARPPRELQAEYGLLQAVLDPYVNAVHVSFLRVKDDPPPASEERFVVLRETLLRKGPAALSSADRLALLLDADSMNLLHAAVWAAPLAQLPDWWRLALQHYTLAAAAPFPERFGPDQGFPAGKTASPTK